MTNFISVRQPAMVRSFLCQLEFFVLVGISTIFAIIFCSWVEVCSLCIWSVLLISHVRCVIIPFVSVFFLVLTLDSCHGIVNFCTGFLLYKRYYLSCFVRC